MQGLVDQTWCIGLRSEKSALQSFLGLFRSPKIQEPVIYVAGRPHVLRIVDRPLENLE